MKPSFIVIQIAILLGSLLYGCADPGERDNPYDSVSASYDPAVAFDSVSTKDISQLYDERDGRIYRVVKIGGLHWMAENLNYQVDSSFCYNDEPDNCNKYGRLYQWAAAVGMNESYNKQNVYMDEDYGKGLCPKGWSLPSLYTWKNLIDYVNGADYLKSKYAWGRDDNGYDSYGFTALPGGFRESNGTYKEESYMASFWTSSEESATIGKKFYMKVGYAGGYEGIDSKYTAQSVRCVKD